MTTKATAIVRARVLDHYTTAKGQTVFTHYRLQVEETLKGVSGTSEVQMPGGTAGNLRQTFSGVPTLTEGKDYLLFLWTGKGSTQLIGFSQGMFEVTEDSSGQPMVSRAATSEMLLDQNGRPVQDQSVRVPLPQFTARVKSILNKGSK